jgi:glycosyltransferase involved in cell wall biosynthesis
MAESYGPYIDDMLAHAAHVLCISRDTRGDLLRWADERGLRTPPSSVLPLGCDLVASDRPIGDGVRALLERSFLLMVGTLEVRKNHETLCRAYGRLVEWGATDLPLLVFVGQIGVGGPELVRTIAADARIRDRVVLLPAASDAELLALYRHCRFVVYPSLAEGWGLPVAEALAHGKFCLASDRTAIPEVGRDFVDYLDPWDVDAWAERIFRFVQLPASVARREAGIRRDYRPPTWEATAAAVLDVVAGLG